MEIFGLALETVVLFEHQTTLLGTFFSQGGRDVFFLIPLCKSLISPEPEFLNVYEAQESIPMNQFRQTM
jgi:hypothetical protein